jgi:hypothetical protein
MVGLVLQCLRLIKALVSLVAEPKGRALASLVTLQLISGTLFYTFVEHWRWLDSLYFCVTTLTTVGLGDLSPVTDAGKIFTIAYIITGVGLLVSLLGMIAEQAADRRAAPGADSPGRSGA